MNPNNCETCFYKQINDDLELHCYMFKDEPTEVCLQHSGRNVQIFRGLPAGLVKDTAYKLQLQLQKKLNNRKKQRRALTGRRR